MDESGIIKRRLRIRRYKAKKKVESELCDANLYKDNINSSVESEHISEPSKLQQQALSTSEISRRRPAQDLGQSKVRSEIGNILDCKDHIQPEHDAGDEDEHEEENHEDEDEHEVEDQNDMPDIESDSSLEDDTPNEIEKLRKWVIDCNIPHSHADKLLDILRPRLLPTLPKTCKTFLKTSSAVYNIEPMEGHDGSIGEFIYFGIEQGLRKCINPKVHVEEMIEILINIDGIKLFKSSEKQFWPILCRVYFNPMIFEPFTVAIFAGDSKPKVLAEYLKKFINEVNVLQTEGFQIQEKTYTIKIKGFVCDTPARSFIKATQGHTGNHCCERCLVVGEKRDKTTVFLSGKCERRNDEKFRAFEDPEHHISATPLLLIDPPIDMINSFVLDFMHLCCLGVMKKLMECWTKGKKKKSKLSNWAKTELSRRLLSIGKCVPCEFQRKPRDLQSLSHWKATEYMFFLLYAGPILLKGILSDLQYNHFLLLHTACRLLCSAHIATKYINYAREYFATFVSKAIDENLYGESFAVLNVHNINHLCDDAMFMGCSLLDVSAYAFENHLGKMNKSIRSPNRLLAQYCRRMHEKCETTNIQPKLTSKVSYTNKEGEISNVLYKGVKVSTVPPNDVFMLQNKSILKITNIFLEAGTLNIKGTKIKIINSVYKYPTDSAINNIWEISSKHSVIQITVPIHSIMSKMVNLYLKCDPQLPKERSFAISYLHQS